MNFLHSLSLSRWHKVCTACASLQCFMQIILNFKVLSLVAFCVIITQRNANCIQRRQYLWLQRTQRKKVFYYCMLSCIHLFWWGDAANIFFHRALGSIENRVKNWQIVLRQLFLGLYLFSFSNLRLKPILNQFSVAIDKIRTFLFFDGVNNKVPYW